MTDGSELDPDAAAGPESGPAADVEPKPPVSRKTLAWVVGPIIVLVIMSQIGDALAPTLAVEHPLLLIMLNARNRNLLLVTNELDAVSYYVVATLRLLAADPPFYILGFLYGDRAIAWVEQRSKTYGQALRQYEGAFRAASYPLVFLAPNNPICLFAGASGMRPLWFAILNVTGTVSRLVFLRAVGEAFEAPISGLLDFIGQYRWPLTALSITIVVVTVLNDRRQGKGELADVKALADGDGDGQTDAAPTAEPPSDGATTEESSSRPIIVGLVVAVLVVAAIGVGIATRGDGDEPNDSAHNDGNVLQPIEGDVVEGDPTCAELGGDGATSTSCGGLDGDEGSLAWMVVERDDRLDVGVFRHDGDGLRPVLAVTDEGPAGSRAYEEVSVATAELTGSAPPELVVTYRLAGSGGTLVVEVVEAPGAVGVIAELAGGEVTIGDGRVVLDEAQYGPEDPDCCPSQYLRRIVRHTERGWVITSQELVDADSRR